MDDVVSIAEHQYFRVFDHVSRCNEIPFNGTNTGSLEGRIAIQDVCVTATNICSQENEMPLLPQLKSMFEAMQTLPTPASDTTPGELREAMHAMLEDHYYSLRTSQDPAGPEKDILIPVQDGEIILRLYLPDDRQSPLPCHIYYHGGGFYLGTLDQSDNTCRALVRELGCAVVSVDYRLSPENPFPVPAEDSYAALLWVAKHAGDIDVDPLRISVGGASAGGNLAAVVAQMARDRSGPRITAQVLEIPVTDFTSNRTLDFAGENIHIGSAKSYAPIYLREERDAHDPLASPLLAASMRGLPPALVMCVEYDQLQPEGEAYAMRLSEAGVQTRYRCWEGQFHGSQMFDKLIPEESSAYRAEITAFLKSMQSATRQASKRC